MKFQFVSGELKSNEDKDVAKLIWDFFLFQYDIALKDEINSRCDYDACVAANEAAEREYKNDPEHDFSWGVKLPYDKNILNYKKIKAEEAFKNLEEAKIVINFIRDRFIDKFV